jgi:hypothetical protein
MGGQRTAANGMASNPASGADWWIGRAAAATVVALAGIAGAISYSHLRQFTQDHGQAGWPALKRHGLTS